MDRIEIVYKCYYTFLTTLYDNLDDHEILIQGEKKQIIWNKNRKR